MSVTEELCSLCSKGYLVAEFSQSERKYNYYCNYCFKYKDLGCTDSSKTNSDIFDNDFDFDDYWSTFMSNID